MAKQDFILDIKQNFAAPIQKVFDAWTKPEQVAEWFGPEGHTNEVHEFNFKVGGKYRITMTGPKGERHTVVGEFKSIDSPSSFAYTWAWEGAPGDPTMVSVELRETGDQTEMHFKHSGFVSAEDKENHNKGWTSSFTKLEKQLA